MEKYIRHTAMKANSHYRTETTRFDLNDVSQNFMLSLNKAINKFDQTKGTITTYVNHWLRDAKNPGPNFTHEYGMAYNIPVAMRRAMATNKGVFTANIAVSLDDEEDHIHSLSCPSLNPEQAAEANDSATRVRILAKRADPTGLARIKLGIEEVLNPYELALLRTAM